MGSTEIVSDKPASYRFAKDRNTYTIMKITKQNAILSADFAYGL